MPAMPDGLGPRGMRLWNEITTEHELDPVQVVLLEECCRSSDRLDELNGAIQGEDVVGLVQEKVLAEARQQQNVLKQLLVSLRLPDAAGKRPQLRGARGSYNPSPEKASNVASMVGRGKRRGA